MDNRPEIASPARTFSGETKEKRSLEDRHESTKAYIDYMRPRCIELHRVLKKTGSFDYRCEAQWRELSNGSKQSLRLCDKASRADPDCFTRFTSRAVPPLDTCR